MNDPKNPTSKDPEKFNPLAEDEDFVIPAVEFRHNPSEARKSSLEDVAYVRETLKRILGGNDAEKAVPAHLDPAVIALATKTKKGKEFDARYQDGPKPSDFGEHAQIPEEAMTIVDVSENNRKLKTLWSAGSDDEVEGSFYKTFGSPVKEKGKP